MWSVCKKELRQFFSSLTGYIAIIVFLLVNGLALFVFDDNIFDFGYATLDRFFQLAPWILLLLIPAITMRSFSEEKKTGTIELLLTRPLTELQIVLAKYFAGVVLVIVSLLPTLIYYYSVHQLGAPKGNVDTGGMWGSYFGLLFLGAGFVAVGTFASAISENQVIAFIMAVLLCFITFIGFDFISASGLFGKYDALVKGLGMNSHYISMSRGVIDTRDLVYFITLIAFFNLLSKLVLESRKW